MLGGSGSGETLLSGSSLQTEQSVQQSTSHHHQFGGSSVYKGHGSRTSTMSTGSSLGIFWLRTFALIWIYRRRTIEVLLLFERSSLHWLTRKIFRFVSVSSDDCEIALASPHSLSSEFVVKKLSDGKCYCIPNLIRKTWWKSPLGRPNRRWEGIYDDVDWIHRIRIWTDVGLL